MAPLPLLRSAGGGTGPEYCNLEPKFVDLGAATIYFVALRTPLRKRALGLAFLVDVLFCLGLILTAIACGLLVMIVL